MKRIITCICAALAVSSLLLLTACGNTNNQQQVTTTPTAVEETTVPPTGAAPEIIKTTDLSKLHAINAQGDQFAGIWQITDGTGSQLQSFYYEFDGNGNAYMMIGTTGYCGTYGITSSDGKDTFVTQLMFGLDGSYTYEFAKDRNSVVLTNIADNTTSTLEKVTDYSPVPAAPENYSIDEALLGAWKDDTGEMLYFDKSGVMYDVQINVTFTFYTYSAADGEINETSVMTEEMEETAEYSVENDTLTYNGYSYQRISTDELC